MGMRKTTVRLPDWLCDLVEQEAARQGISFAQFLRDAALLTLAWHQAQSTTAVGAVAEQRAEIGRSRTRYAPRRGDAENDDPSYR